jgi:hypothetical protein
MVKIDELNQTENNNQTETYGSQTKGSEKCGFDAQKQNNQTQSSPNQKSGLMTIIGQLLPLAPFVFEQFTGQKVPHMTGTMADIQSVLNNLQLVQSQIINQQNQIVQRLSQLESNAVQSLNSLNNQFQSLRLTHTQEKKQIEFNPRPELKDTEENY